MRGSRIEVGHFAIPAELGNSDFVARAPAEKVEELRTRIADIAQRAAAMEQMMEALK